MSGHLPSSSADETPRGNADFLALRDTLSKSLYLLAIGPLLVGAITFVATDWLPKRYVSTAQLNPGAGEVETTDPGMGAWRASMLKTVPALMVSPDVLQAAGSTGTRLSASQVRTRVSASEGSIALSVTAASPAQAQQLAQALVEATIAASLPKGDERSRLEAERKRLTDQILLLETTARQLREALSRASTAQETGALAGAVPSVMEHTVTLERRLALNTARLTGLTKTAIVTPPTLPTEAAGPRRGLWSVIAALGAMCLLISAVLLKRAWLDLRRTHGPAGCQQGQPKAEEPGPSED